MDAPTIPVSITTGDYVQATFIAAGVNGAPDEVTVGTFLVKTVGPGGVITGSKKLGPVDTANGWVVELLTKAPENVALPEKVAEIAAWSRTNEVLHLIGKKDAWRDADTGLLVEPEMIQGWKEWDGWAAEADLYQEHLDQLEPAPVGIDAPVIEGTSDV